MKLTHRSRATVVAVLAASVLALPVQAGGGPPWGPEAPPFNLQVVLRDVAGGPGFGQVRFRQPNDADKIVYLDTWVRDLAPRHSYVLRRAVDTALDGECTGTAWLELGTITTDGRGTGRAELSRDLGGLATGLRLDIHFQLIDAVTSAPVLASGCYRFAVSQ
jgi:hypothetical protein